MHAAGIGLTVGAPAPSGIARRPGTHARMRAVRPGEAPTGSNGRGNTAQSVSPDPGKVDLSAATIQSLAAPTARRRQLRVDNSRNDEIITPVVRALLTITKALADPNRIRLLMVLREGERCVCQLIELLGLAGSTVSKHLSVLSQAGLVASRKDERWVHYRLADVPAESPGGRALAWLQDSLAGDPQVKADRRHMGAILRENPSALCKRQGTR